MTRIDFYLLDDPTANATLRYACRLTEKAFLLGHQVYVHTESAAQSSALDDLMWTFQAGSFLPHALAGSAAAAEAPVLIGHEALEPPHHEVLINLSAKTPDCFGTFDRVAELVGPDETARRQARERYRFYRDRGYPLDTHNLSGS